MRTISRRTFLRASALPALAALLPAVPLSAGSPRARWGADISWAKGDFETLLAGLQPLGITGVMGGPAVFGAFGQNPVRWRRLLRDRGMRMPVLWTGPLPVGFPAGTDPIPEWVKMAAFAREAGAEFLAVSLPARDSYPPGKEKLLKTAGELNRLGEEVKKKGVRLLLRNQMHTICQTGEEVKILLAASNPSSFGFMPDLAHLAQGGSDPARMLTEFRKQTGLVFVSDLIAPRPGHTGKKDFNYQITETGKGNKIDWPAVFRALADSRFKGWCILGGGRAEIQPAEATASGLKFLKTSFRPRL